MRDHPSGLSLSGPVLVRLGPVLVRLGPVLVRLGLGQAGTTGPGWGHRAPGWGHRWHRLAVWLAQPGRQHPRWPGAHPSPALHNTCLLTLSLRMCALQLSECARVSTFSG